MRTQFKYGIVAGVGLLVLGASLAFAFLGGGASQPIQAASKGSTAIDAAFRSAYDVRLTTGQQPAVEEGSAIESTVDRFMKDMGLPSDMGISGMITGRAQTAIASGSHLGYGDWDYFDRPVWVVSLEDVPLWLPCGPYAPNDCPAGPPHYSALVDATTGEILSTEVTGGGNPDAKWNDLQAQLIDRAQAGNNGTMPTATPVP